MRRASGAPSALELTDASDSKQAVRVASAPFPLCELQRLFTPDACAALRDEVLSKPPFTLRSNDLYHFHQSIDLANHMDSAPLLRQLHELVISDAFVGMVESLAGIQLVRGRADLSAHRYPPGGYLLCHDDDIREETEAGLARRVAFILYLVEEDWAAEDGGRLDLFGSRIDEASGRRAPTTTVERAVCPQRGTLAFFVVEPHSFHQVSLVTHPTRDRVSISGWLYGPIDKRETVPATVMPSGPVPSAADDSSLDFWIKDTYRSSQAMDSIRERFASDSMIELRSFLRDDLYQRIVRELDDGWAWNAMPAGPPNPVAAQPLVLRLLRFMQSPTFREYIHSLTQTEAPSTDSAAAACELRLFRRGLDYTLANDLEPEPAGLDVILGLQSSSKAWDDETWHGGMHYIVSGEVADEMEDPHLLELPPAHNSLMLVLRDPSTLRFVRIVQPTAPEARRELSLVIPVAFDDEDDNEE
ncbi:hypothetical protein GQ42DRAFT_120727 [Ramicandelaber brevisporus]|nr:hypothetical protein GQ42DRAFT_120727 [Ramicandelaber brevisporus]